MISRSDHKPLATYVRTICSKEFALYQAVCTGAGLVKAACYSLGFGAAHEALFVNRAGVLAFRVLSAPVQIDLPQAAVQKSPDRLGVALEVKTVRAGVVGESHGVGTSVSSTHSMSECEGVMLPGIQAVFSFIRY